MAGISLNEILLALVGWLLAMIFAGMFGVWAWAIWRLLTGRRILPEQPMVNVGRANWGAGTILLVMLLYSIAGVLIPWGYRWATGGPPKKHGTALQALAAAGPTPIAKDKRTEIPPDPYPAKASKPATAKSGQDQESLLDAEGMFVLSVINSVLLVLVPLLVRFTSGARLRDLGVCLDGWIGQAAVGVGAMLFIAPICELVQFEAFRSGPPNHLTTTLSRRCSRNNSRQVPFTLRLFRP